jgi:hypothetical protein
MAEIIAILDDEPDRLAVMVPLLRGRFPQFSVVTFDNAPDMNAWLADHLAACVLICLDHDLGPNRERNGTVFDPGIGRHVADYLSAQQPVCPVIIHTTNVYARPGMIQVLEDAGWLVEYVAPYGDVLWIGEVWADSVGNALS